MPSLALALGLLVQSTFPCALCESLEEARRRDHLPLAFALSMSEELEVVFHHDGQRAMAYYWPFPEATAVSPADEGSMAVARSDVEGEVRPMADSPTRGPRLVLFAPYYRHGSGLVDLMEMPVDVAEYYFHALLLAYLHLAVLSEETAYGESFRHRAQELMVDLPAEHRLGAYLEAVVSFGSYILSLAHELERKIVVRGREGRDLCHELSQGLTLFGLWRRAFKEGAFVGSYTEQKEGPIKNPRYSRFPLTQRDKRLLLDYVFEGRWTGDPVTDFQRRYCRAGAP